MGHLHSRNIIIGVTGGIAAYKIAELIRLLRGDGASVRIILSRGAQAFVTPLTLQSLSGYPVHTELLDETAEMGMGHIELARWADIFLVAPATADTVARLAAGRADDLLTTAALATPAPLFVAPAMNQHMWNNAATTANIQTLRERGVKIIGPDAGEQACGDVGAGRLTEPETISAEISAHFPTRALEGKRAIITAGPTREPMDPVRYISNHSSGKMGYAIAQAAQIAGANVKIISGPVSIPTPKGCEKIAVESALQMHQQALELAKNADVFVACAAVADYRVEEVSPQKIKKSADDMQINLVKNPDIVADVAALAAKPFTVGFAAETQDVEHYALGKLKRKNLDMIAANNVALSGQGFNSDDNALTVFSSKNKTELPLASKQILAEQLVQLISQYYK